ncbi:MULTISPECIES: magnesium/cobalt transporter CorA [unclassified Yoonia]|uniref:magnesium/cobalt transporter CorA n=1 Tax=unclassified Yoonia TaxID=2629118 RepID=UPI002AFEB332|nr:MULTISPECIES: magnesium/cobalt transporter CorA [unclassified Yoonia]
MRQPKPHPTKHRRRTKPGAAPGTLTVAPQAVHPQIQMIAYGPDSFTETVNVAASDLAPTMSVPLVRWINIDGLGDIPTLQQIGKTFGLHPLALEDIVNLHQRPKVDAYEGHLFIVLRMPIASAARLETEQVTMVLGRDHVVSFQERPGDSFDPVRHRLRAHGGQIRQRGADYLAYALIDAAIDAFFPILETYGEQVEDLEDDVITQPGQKQMARIHDLKRNLLTARRALWPMRDMVNALLREESTLINAQTLIYLRDCQDHIAQLIEMIETYREICSGLIDIHLSSVSNKMNEVMKVLTIIATIFIPLTFIVGVYGMNFDPAAGPWSMPELGWRYGYPAVLITMAGIAVGLLIWFRSMGWIGRDRD